MTKQTTIVVTGTLRVNSVYSDRETRANDVDPDQMPDSDATKTGILITVCMFATHPALLDTLTGSKMCLFKF